jgi:hypothetical protein
MNMDDYPHCSLGEDGCLRTTGRHRPGFPRLLLSALVRHGYDGLVPVYHCHPFQAHGLNAYEVRVEIPNDPTVQWKGDIIESEVDDAVEKMAYVALTALCERRLTDNPDTLITLFPIHIREELEWQKRLEVVCDLTSPHFSIC